MREVNEVNEHSEELNDKKMTTMAITIDQQNYLKYKTMHDRQPLHEVLQTILVEYDSLRAFKESHG